MVSLVIVDQNRYPDLYITSTIIGVKTISKNSSMSVPALNSSTCILSIPVSSWSTMMILTKDKVSFSIK